MAASVICEGELVASLMTSFPGNSSMSLKVISQSKQTALYNAVLVEILTNECPQHGQYFNVIFSSPF